MYLANFWKKMVVSSSVRGRIASNAPACAGSKKQRENAAQGRAKNARALGDLSRGTLTLGAEKDGPTHGRVARAAIPTPSCRKERLRVQAPKERVLRPSQTSQLAGTHRETPRQKAGGARFG